MTSAPYRRMREVVSSCFFLSAATLSSLEASYEMVTWLNLPNETG
jgi:hypothetical protein